MDVLEGNALRDPSKTTPWLVEIANEANPNGKLPRCEFSLTDRDFCLLKYKTRCGDGFTKSREIQYQAVFEHKYWHENLGGSQIDNLIKNHLQLIRPYELVHPGERLIKNNTFSRPIKYQGNRIVSFGLGLFRMDGKTAAESSRIQLWRWFVQKKRHGSQTVEQGRGCWEVELADLKRFDIDLQTYWSILRFERDFDNPSKPWDDRSHKKQSLIRREVSTPLGFKVQEEFVHAGD
jgi:hypothetical protein